MIIFVACFIDHLNISVIACLGKPIFGLPLKDCVDSGNTIPRLVEEIVTYLNDHGNFPRPSTNVYRSLSYLTVHGSFKHSFDRHHYSGRGRPFPNFSAKISDRSACWAVGFRLSRVNATVS